MKAGFSMENRPASSQKKNNAATAEDVEKNTHEDQSGIQV